MKPTKLAAIPAVKVSRTALQTALYTVALSLLCLLLVLCNPQRHVTSHSQLKQASDGLDRGLAAASSLHRDAWAWLQFAEADAAAAGTDVSTECAELQGVPFLQRWTSTCSRVCGGDPATPAQQPASSVECCGYPVKNTGLACRADNLVVDTTAFMGPAVKGESGHEKYMPQGRPGSVQLNCLAPQPHEGQPGSKVVWQDELGLALEHEHLPWFKAAAEHNTSSTHSICNGPGAHTVAHPVMFVTRVDTTNAYHHTQSLVQAFLSMAVLNASTMPPFQVIIADRFDAGPFTEIWRRLSHPFPLVSLSSFANASQPTCFTKSMHAHYALPGEAFLGYEGIDDEHACPSHILMAAAHWQRYLFKEILPSAERREYEALEATQLSSLHSHASGQPPAAAAAAGPAPQAGLAPSASEIFGVSTAAASVQQRRLHVVWLSRAWFGRSMRAGGGLNGWQASRDLPHSKETEIVKALVQTVLDWNRNACAQPTFGWWQKPHAVRPQTDCKQTQVAFDFRFVELSLEDLYPDQVELLTRTAVLVGIHGAALNNLLWMRPHRGAVVEFGAGGKFHYRNMAQHLGHKHFKVDTSADAIASAAYEAMDHVSSRY